MKKILRGIAAAFTTPDAIEQEKKFGVFVATRIIIGVGGSVAFADIVARLIEKL